MAPSDCCIIRQLVVRSAPFQPHHGRKTWRPSCAGSRGGARERNVRAHCLFRLIASGRRELHTGWHGRPLGACPHVRPTTGHATLGHGWLFDTRLVLLKLRAEAPIALRCSQSKPVGNKVVDRLFEFVTISRKRYETHVVEKENAVRAFVQQQKTLRTQHSFVRPHHGGTAANSVSFRPSATSDWALRTSMDQVRTSLESAGGP